MRKAFGSVESLDSVDGTRARRGLVTAAALAAAALAGGGSSAWAAYPGPNGRIAFLERTGVFGDNSGQALIRSVGPAGGAFLTHETCLAGCRLMGTPAWSRFVSRLAFTDNGDTIVSENPTGGDQQPAVEKALYAYEPAWGPQGGALVYTFHPGDGGFGRPDLWIKPSAAAPAPSRRLTYRRGRQAAWSRTNRIAFVRGGDVTTNPGAGDVYIVRPDGRGLRRLTYKGGVEPAWSPYATKIVFRRGTDVYHVGANGKKLRRLTHLGGSQPAWSPDGKRIAFVRSGDVWTVRTDGTGLVRVHESTDFAGTAFADQPDWGRVP